jgi:ABC-type sulfate transport system substrate-binding protein
MRSDLIFPAVKTVRNRYTLCQIASKATRKFHKPNTRIQETMNEILQRMGTAPPEQVVGHAEVLAEVQKRAA